MLVLKSISIFPIPSFEKYQSIFPEQLDQAGRPKEIEETNLEKFRPIDDPPNHGDKVKSVPEVFELVLERQVCFRQFTCLLGFGYFTDD